MYLKSALEILLSSFLILGPISFICKQRHATITSIIISIIGLLSSLYIFFSIGNDTFFYKLGGFINTAGISFGISAIDGIMLVYIASFSVLTMIIGGLLPAQICLLLLTAFSLFGLIITHDLFNAYVFIEIISLSTYTLVYNPKNNLSSITALKYLIYGTIFASIYLLGVGCIYAATGSLNFEIITEYINNHGSNNSLINLGRILIYTGIILKCGIYPLTKWLVEAYLKAENNIFFFLTSTLSKTYLYFIIKIHILLFGIEYQNHKYLTLIAILLGIFSSIASNILAYKANELKRASLYTSIGTVGVVLSLLFLMENPILAFTYLIFDGIIKGGIYIVANNIKYSSLDNTNTKISGFDKTITILALISAIGIPGTLGFWNKFLVLSSQIKHIQYAHLILYLYIFVLNFMVFLKYFKDYSNGIFALKKFRYTEKIILFFLIIINLLLGIYLVIQKDLLEKLLS